MSKLGDALFTTTQQNVLGLLYGRPERSFYTNEILRLTGMGVHTIKRELDRMTDAGILVQTTIGNQKHYQANLACPIYQELLGVIQKTIGLADVLRETLGSMDKHIAIAFVYGSIAKNKERADSDIDLMVIGSDLSYAELMERLLPAGERLQRTINPALYSASEFKRKLKQGNHFLERVMQQEKIMVIGREDDIGRIA